MREYETVYILDPAMTEADVKASLTKYSDMITRHSGSIFRSASLGKKSLAYRIKKQTKGYYVSIDYCGDNTVVSDVERNLKLDEKVMRYLTVKLDEEVDVEARKQQLIDEAKALELAMAESAANAAKKDMPAVTGDTKPNEEVLNA